MNQNNNMDSMTHQLELYIDLNKKLIAKTNSIKHQVEESQKIDKLIELTKMVERLEHKIDKIAPAPATVVAVSDVGSTVGKIRPVLHMPQPFKFNNGPRIAIPVMGARVGAGEEEKSNSFVDYVNDKINNLSPSCDLPSNYILLMPYYNTFAINSERYNISLHGIVFKGRDLQINFGASADTQCSYDYWNVPESLIADSSTYGRISLAHGSVWKDNKYRSSSPSKPQTVKQINTTLNVHKDDENVGVLNNSWSHNDIYAIDNHLFVGSDIHVTFNGDGSFILRDKRDKFSIVYYAKNGKTVIDFKMTNHLAEELYVNISGKNISAGSKASSLTHPTLIE